MVNLENNNKIPSQNEGNTRRNFLKKLGLIGTMIAVNPAMLFANSAEKAPNYTQLIRTNQKFKNGEYVYNVENNSNIVGEFWPIKGINLVTKKTNPEIFNRNTGDIIDDLGGVATSPDGMTTGAVGNYEMQGKSLANGVECGDGKVYNYGILLVKNGFDITFTHKQEINDFDNFYNEAKLNKDTIIFLPSLYRNGRYLDSEKTVDKALIHRKVPGGEQIGTVLFKDLVTYNKAREIILGLDRKNTSETTHIYMLDGGGTWGQSAKKVNGITEIIGTRDPKKVTNYLVFY